MIINTGLFHDFICSVPDINFSVYGKISIAYWTMPDIMVASAMPHEITAKFPQNLTDFFFIFSHYAVTA
jgi:hypothetical protein